MLPTMEIIVNDGRDRDIYPGTTAVKIDKTPALLEYRGGVTMTIQFTHQKDSAPISQIVVDPNVRGGVPCIGSGHWPIAQLLEKLASGTNLEALIRDYPNLTLADIQLALRASAWVMRDPAINWSELHLPEMVDFQDEIQAWQNLDNGTLDAIDNL